MTHIVVGGYRPWLRDSRKHRVYNQLMRMGASAPPPFSFFKKHEKQKIIMGHIDEMLVAKLEANTMNSKYLDFCGGFVGNLVTGNTITDAEADVAGAASPSAAEILAATLVDGEIVACEFDGGAAGALYCPRLSMVLTALSKSLETLMKRTP